MPKYFPPPHKFRPKTLDSTDTVDFTHFRRTVNRYCDSAALHIGTSIRYKHTLVGNCFCSYVFFKKIYPLIVFLSMYMSLKEDVCKFVVSFT